MLVSLLLFLPILLISIVLHEVSHGWVAHRLGDQTAKSLGRLSLNPLKHIDLFGTILIPGALLLTGSPVVFGWAKPVPISAWQLRNPRRDMIWVGLAGPVANLLLAVAIAVLAQAASLPRGSWLESISSIAVVMNLVLAVFNLLPIPPLDGSRVLFGLLPPRAARVLAALERFGFVLLIALMIFGVTSRLIWPVVTRLAGLLGIEFGA